MENLLREVKPLIVNYKRVYILGGHFPLILEPESHSLIPGIPEDLADFPQLQEEWRNHPYVGRFANETFKVSLELLRPEHSDKITLLANDWQFIPRAEENTQNEWRDGFYKNYTFLPQSFRENILVKGLQIEDVVVKPAHNQTKFNNPFYFSETKFRNRYRNRSEYASCELGNACAQEFLPFMLEMNKAVDCMVAFIPPTCQRPTTDAIIEAKEKFNMKMDVISVIPFYTSGKQNFWSEVWIAKNGELVKHQTAE